MSELEQYIKSYFGVIKTNDISTIGNLFKSETIKKGDYFLRAGRPCNKLSFVQEGFLRMFVHLEEKEVTQWISTQGFFVTDISSFMFGGPSRWNIQALSDTQVFTISKESYGEIKSLVPQWPDLERLFLSKCFVMMEDRIFSHLSMSSEERYHLFFENNASLFNEIPLQYIASMLGMTPETFSRIRKKRNKSIS